MTTFASDNYAGVHPEVRRAIAAADGGHETSYGDDPVTARAVERVRGELGDDVEVAFVFNGTAANVLALDLCLRSHEAVVCAATAHVNVDECGAPERWLGAKLVAVPTGDGKISPTLLDAAITGVGDQHRVQARVVSVSQSTELGTLYALDELRDLADHAHRRGLLVHLDGARIANAAAALGVSLREATRGCNVDVLSFGGTKNGLMGVEAVVVFRPELAAALPFRRKQAMQLASKMRFLSAQFEALLTDDLWRRNASHANAMATRLAAGLAVLPGVSLVQRAEANGVFVRLPVDAIGPLQAVSPFYVWEEPDVIRLMCAWDTAPADVDAFVAAAAAILG
jgi:threonine aldolase